MEVLWRHDEQHRCHFCCFIQMQMLDVPSPRLSRCCWCRSHFWCWSIVVQCTTLSLTCNVLLCAFFAAVSLLDCLSLSEAALRAVSSLFRWHSGRPRHSLRDPCRPCPSRRHHEWPSHSELNRGRPHPSQRIGCVPLPLDGLINGPVPLSQQFCGRLHPPLVASWAALSFLWPHGRPWLFCWSINHHM